MNTNSSPARLTIRARTTTPPRQLSLRRAWFWTGCLAFATLAFGPPPAQAAVTEAWLQRYGSEAGSQDSAYQVVTDAAGNVFVAGFLGLIKYSGAGMPLWTNVASGTAIALDGSGNVFVTGSSVGSEGNSDYTTIACSGAGVPLWTNRYNGPAHGEDAARAVAVDGSDNVFVTGNSKSGGEWDYATIAYSGAGVPLWTNRYNGSGNGWDKASAVAVDGSGNVFVTGRSAGSGDLYNYATIAYSGTGVPLWTNRYEGPANGSDEANAVAVDGSGNVFVTGYSVGSEGDEDYTTIAYSGAGVPLWTNRFSAERPESKFLLV